MGQSFICLLEDTCQATKSLSTPPLKQFKVWFHCCSQHYFHIGH